jgi:hypothetical protein
MKNLLASWFRNLTAFDEGPIEQSFSIVDPTAAQKDGLNTVILSVSPSDGTAPTIVSLRFDPSGVKLFEKKYQNDEEAKTEMSAMATDLNEAASLSKSGKTEEAKRLAESLFEKYKRHSEPVVNEQPTPTMTQAALESTVYKGFSIKKLEDGSWQGKMDEVAYRADSLDTLKAKIDNALRKAYGKQLKNAAITQSNWFFDTVDEAMEFQEKMKALQGPEDSEEGKPLWEQMGNGDNQVAPSNESKVEEDNELAPPSLSFDRIEKDKAKTDKDIGKRIKDQVKTEVESALEQKSASVFGSDQEELVEALRKNGRNWDEIKKIFTKELSYNEDDTTVFLDSIRQKEEGSPAEGLPLPPKPPEDLVSPDTHDKLIKEIEDKSEPKSEPLPLADEIARADNAEIRKVAASYQCKYCKKWYHEQKGVDQHIREKHLEERNKDKESSLEIKALNPLQEPPAVGQTPGQPLAAPVEEAPTFDSPVPAAPEPTPEPEFLEAPQAGDRVYVMGDYETGEDGYEGTMISDYTSKGDEYAVISKDDGENAEVALHRVVKASQKKVAKAYYEKVAGPVYCKHDGCNRKATVRLPEGNYCEKHAPAKKEAKHEHTYQKGKSGIEICPCGRFRFPEEYLKTHPPIVEKTEQKEASGGHCAGCGKDLPAVWGTTVCKECVDKGFSPEHKEADLEVEGKANEDVIRMFISDSFPKDKMPVWGTSNLKITKYPNGWALVNYNTPILYRANGSDTVVFNTHKYSVTTSKIQSQIRRNFAGQPVKETDEAGIYSAIDQSNLSAPEPEVTPELQSLHESALKLQADLEHEDEIAIYFHKEGIEKNADIYDDSAFESNGWCRVWVQELDITSDAKYTEILKLADETARVDALKDLARDLAHEALRLADSSASKVGVQAWFESLHPSDHDRIDWDALANPTQENVESAQNPKIEKKAEYPGGPCAGCGKELPTVWGATFCKECVDKGLDKKHFEKKAADPVPAPEIPVTYKELQKAPPYTDRSKALPANQEQVEVAKNLQISMASIESIKDLVKRVKADLEKRILALQQAGGLSQLEEEKKKQVDQLSALINATENKLISYGEHLYGYSEQTKKVGPTLTDAWRVEKLVEKFAGAAEYLKAAEAGAQNMAKEVTTKTLTKFPKLSRLDKQAGFLDSLNDVYSNVLEALKLIIGSDEPAVV